MKCWQTGIIGSMEDDTIKTFTVRLPETLIERIKIRAVKERRSLQELAQLAFEAYLKTPIAREERT
jgi:predicted HicB family RNase H-like nuclease